MKKTTKLISGILLTGSFLAASLLSCQTKTSSEKEPSSNVKSNNSPIQGSWEIVESNFTGKDTSRAYTPFRSILIFTDKFYSVAIARVDRPSWPKIPKGEKVSYDNLTNAYDNFVSNAGRYEITGDSIIYHIIVAKSPNYMNDTKNYSQAFVLDGNKLITHSANDSGEKTMTTYKRFE